MKNWDHGHRRHHHPRHHHHYEQQQQHRYQHWHDRCHHQHDQDTISSIVVEQHRCRRRHNHCHNRRHRHQYHHAPSWLIIDDNIKNTIGLPANLHHRSHRHQHRHHVQYAWKQGTRFPPSNEYFLHDMCIQICTGFSAESVCYPDGSHLFPGVCSIALETPKNSMATHESRTIRPSCCTSPTEALQKL